MRKEPFPLKLRKALSVSRESLQRMRTLTIILLIAYAGGIVWGVSDQRSSHIILALAGVWGMWLSIYAVSGWIDRKPDMALDRRLFFRVGMISASTFMLMALAHFLLAVTGPYADELGIVVWPEIIVGVMLLIYILITKKPS